MNNPGYWAPQAWYRNGYLPLLEDGCLGFRVANVSEPAALCLPAPCLIAAACHRPRRRTRMGETALSVGAIGAMRSVQG